MRNINRYFLGIAGIILVIGVIVMLFLPGLLGYIAHVVESDQIGVVTQYGEVVDVVGPGTYTDPFRLFAEIYNVRISATQFLVEDPEVLTRGGEQALGVAVAGDVFRPNLLTLPREQALRLWSLYRPLMQDDSAVLQRVTTMTQQAMKECVGERTFEQAAVGEGRDDLRLCIDRSLDTIGSEIGLTFQNVSVPNIILTDAQRSRIDEITNSRTAAQLARQDAERARAEGERDAAIRQAAAQAEIAPTQAWIEARATQAVLERAAIEVENQARLAALEAQREQQAIQLEISRIQAEIALLQARINNATVEHLAQIMQEHPEYAAVVRAEHLDNVLRGIQIMYLPEGVNPLVALGYQQLAPGVFSQMLMPTAQPK
jgi:hypothetical protein